MLVYATRLRVQGADAEWAVFKAVGGWLKEQLGFGLPADQLKQDGEHRSCGSTAVMTVSQSCVRGC